MNALIALLVLGATPNPCTNGSFEKVAPNGFAADWQAVGSQVELTEDAHSGKRAVRLVRTPETKSRETGLNRGWKPFSGQQGAMIAQLKGGVEFWYKALSARDAQLTVCVIPMTADPIERTGSPREVFVVPAEHVGDGAWHRGRLKYDFTDNPKVRWVHFAARIVGEAGEILLDDFAYVERVGALLEIRSLRLEETEGKEGTHCRLTAEILNPGDAPADGVRVVLEPPPGLDVSPPALRLAPVPPDGSRKVEFALAGRREGGTLRLSARSPAARASRTLPLAPGVALERFAVLPVVFVGEALEATVSLRNGGNAFARGGTVLWTVSCGTRAAERSVLSGAIAPGTARSIELALPGEELGAAAQAAGRARVAVRVSCGAAEKEQKAEAEVKFIPRRRAPRPSGKLRALANDAGTLLENEVVRLVLHRDTSGKLSVGELATKVRRRWRSVAWLPELARVVAREASGNFIDAAVGFETAEATNARQARLTLVGRCRIGEVRVAFAASRQEPALEAEWTFTPSAPGQLLALDGPMLYATERDEAVFPGLEWLVGDEFSSSALDIAEDHPHRKRFVVHPNMITVPAIGVHGPGGTVGLLWDARQKWDGVRDRPAAVFASPDRLLNHAGHLLGLFLPSVPDYVEPNALRAKKPYPLRPGRPLRLRCHILADGRATDALAAVDHWLRLHGLPEPSPLPHGSYEREIEFSMRGYLDSLWDAETRQWWTSKRGNPFMSRLARPRAYVADLLLGATVSPDPAVRERCRARAEEVLKLIGGPARIDAQRFPGRFDLAVANPARAATLLAGRGEDNAWHFDADRKDTGVFKGKDYHELGPDEAVEVGTCARNAFLVLRYARAAGDAEAFRRLEPTLELMESFRVPRAAQVWEVPVHTPDVLAAADAVDAYLEAYRFSGDERWLRDAVTWARRGLPFIYLWGEPDRPFLLGASIPVFGATWYHGSWFGRPVQWNGLRYANALLKLAKHDESYPWRRIAELIIRSAIHQQAPSGEDAALWPDNISAITARRCPWVFAPRQIIRNILKLTGRDEDPETVLLRRRRLLGPDRLLAITATGRVADATWTSRLLSFQVAHPPGEQGCALVANIEKPSVVRVAGQEVPQQDDLERQNNACWRYDPAYAYLAIRIPRSGPVRVEVEPARHTSRERIPRLTTALEFEFRRDPEGWIPAHDIAQLSVRDGKLVGKITGGDPYLVRSLLRVRGDECPVVAIRMRCSEGGAAQFFWATADSPGFSEERSVRFNVAPGGNFRDYLLQVGRHELWRGHTISAIRIDPLSGVAPATFDILFVRGQRP